MTHSNSGGPVTLLKFQMAPRLIILMPSGSKKEPRYTCLSETEAALSRRIWAYFSSSAPHFLHNWLSEIPIRWRFLLKVLCPCIPIHFFLNKTSVGFTFNVLLFVGDIFTFRPFYRHVPMPLKATGIRSGPDFTMGVILYLYLCCESDLTRNMSELRALTSRVEIHVRWCSH